MNNRERLELQRRMKKDVCTFTKMYGCYVGADKNYITTFKETFLNLDDAEYFKYLDIAKKTLSGKLGDNLLELSFLDSEKSGQKDLLCLRNSGLKNDEMLEVMRDMMCASYDYAGNYLILIFHDVYDVITKTTDNNKLDESEEVYEYLLCAICPVKLTKPGLTYYEKNDCIASRICDWVVGEPETGFLFPAFTDRKEDRNAVMFYTKDAKHPHSEYIDGFLGCQEKLTNTERREDLKAIMKEVLEDDDERYNLLNEQLLEMVENPAMEDGKEKQAIIDAEMLWEILEELEDEPKEVIVQQYKDACEGFGYPRAEELLDEKAAGKARIFIAKEEIKERMETMKKYLHLAAEQLERPDEHKEGVYSSIRSFLEGSDR